MDANNPREEERVVYMALKDVFKDTLAQIRKPKPIRNVISRHRQVAKVADLIKRYDATKIYDTTRRLLVDGVFASAEKARTRFPSPMELPPVVPAEEAAPEVKAAQDGRDALSDSEVAGERLSAPMASQFWQPIKALAMAKQPFSVHLPFPSQHKLMVHLQDLLERACYGFATKYLPHQVQQLGCDCPEAKELHHWLELLSKKSTVLQVKSSKKPPDLLCRSVSNIRHTAVHRLRITAAAVENLILDAEDFAELLGDTATAQAIALIKLEVQGTVKELAENTRHAHQKLDDTMHDIRSQREELQKRQKLAMDELQRENSEYQSLAARSINSVIPLPERRPVLDLDLEAGEIVMVNGIVVREGPGDEEMGGYESD